MKRKSKQCNLSIGTVDFRLVAEEAVDGDRVKREKQQREKDRAEAEKLQETLL